MSFGTLRYVDSIITTPQPSFLFRGGSPVVNNASFDYGGLVDAIQTAGKAVGKPVPDNFYLVDFSLLDPTGTDGQELAVERQFFESNPTDGQLQWWRTQGTTVCYFTTPQDQRAQLLATLDQWMPEPMITRTNELRAWLANPPIGADGRPWVLYVHCDGGCDRTGEVIGTYQMRYLGLNWIDMYCADPCSYPLSCPQYRALQWYGFWLNTQPLGINISGIGQDDGCFDWTQQPPKTIQGCPASAC